jgi:hypothetical protein
MPSPKPATAADASKPSLISLRAILECPHDQGLPSYLHNTEPMDVEALPIQVALLTAEVAWLRHNLVRTMNTVSWLVKIYDRGRDPDATD